jgi:hypothetical protein
MFDFSAFEIDPGHGPLCQADKDVTTLDPRTPSRDLLDAAASASSASNSTIGHTTTPAAG